MRLALAALGVPACVAAAGLLFAWSGLYNVAASTGHWPITAWFLHFAMQNSVETHARGPEPKLDSSALVERGAGHFETGCAPCHGAPGQRGDIILQAMVPPPPELSPIIGKWTTDELFWIVKHGIKYAGMPAWLAPGRDDEVWAMTAFLEALPGIAPDTYRRLAFGGEPHASGGADELDDMDGAPEPSRRALIRSCARCHGEDGAGRPSGAFPRLDLQSADYLARALAEYASGVRPSGIMQPVANALDDREIRMLAEHFALRESRAAQTDHASPDIVARGRDLAERGDAARGIPACGACHGLENGPANPVFPAIAGQFAGFTIDQLALWRAGARGDGPFARIMQAAAANLSSQDVEAVAGFYESLGGPPASRGAAPPS